MKKITLLIAATLLSGCYNPLETSWQLYRTSLGYSNAQGFYSDPSRPVHIAAFDNHREVEEYNRSNCEMARDLFQSQPNVKTVFWCQKGRM